MKLNMYSLYDAKAEIFHPPFYKHTHGEAERDTRTLVNDGKSMVNKYPEDYDLYHVGTYDDKTGKIDSLDTPIHQIKCIQLVEKSPNLSLN